MTKPAVKARNILLRLTPDEFEAVENAAAGTSKQQFVRAAVLAAAGVPVEVVPPRRGANGVVAHLPRCTCSVCKPKPSREA